MNLSSADFNEWLKHKIIPPESLCYWRKMMTKENKTIVSINGSFDLMHSGHLHILFEASKQGDFLIVGLNTDDSIRQYKSPLRPIITLQDRLAMVASLKFVDYVSYFNETTPDLWLEKVLPHVHVNGAEYGKSCIEAPTLHKIKAKLHLVDRIEGLATSQIIEKIKSL
jgi:rfaE bifunctional protein nucleotidyltransferase chain/domain